MPYRKQICTQHMIIAFFLPFLQKLQIFFFIIDNLKKHLSKNLEWCGGLEKESLSLKYICGVIKYKPLVYIKGHTKFRPLFINKCLMPDVFDTLVHLNCNLRLFGSNKFLSPSNKKKFYALLKCFLPTLQIIIDSTILEINFKDVFSTNANICNHVLNCYHIPTCDKSFQKKFY